MLTHGILWNHVLPLLWRQFKRVFCNELVRFLERCTQYAVVDSACSEADSQLRIATPQSRQGVREFCSSCIGDQSTVISARRVRGYHLLFGKVHLVMCSALCVDVFRRYLEVLARVLQGRHPDRLLERHPSRGQRRGHDVRQGHGRSRTRHLGKEQVLLQLVSSEVMPCDVGVSFSL